MHNKNRIFKFLLTTIIFFSFGVFASKEKKMIFNPPQSFIKEETMFPTIIPTYFKGKADKRISLIIPSEVKINQIPMTSEGKIHPDFLAGRANLNSQFGIKNWSLDKHDFKTLKDLKVLTMVGKYKSPSGTETNFIEKHYFAMNKKMQSIQLIYPKNANETEVAEAQKSLESFVPNIE